jgi:hypothetical protein
VGTVAVIAAATVVVGQPLQRGLHLLPVAAVAGLVATGLGAQQPTRPHPVPLGGRRVAVGDGRPAGPLVMATRGKRLATGQAAAPWQPGRPVSPPAGGVVAGAAAHPSRATLPRTCFAGLSWSRP